MYIKVRKKRYCKRNIIWCSSPFSKNGSTEISKYFLNIRFKYFSWNHLLHKIFNRISVKISYGWWPKRWKNYNRNIVGSKPSMNTSTCNCRNKEACPLNRQCQIGKVIYKVIFPSHRTNYKKKKYFGIAVESFKARPYNRNLSFRDKFSKSDADFSKELLQTKKKSYTLEITLENYQKISAV